MQPGGAMSRPIFRLNSFRDMKPSETPGPLNHSSQDLFAGMIILLLPMAIISTDNKERNHLLAKQSRMIFSYHFLSALIFS
jgi:hypothetical protein